MGSKSDMPEMEKAGAILEEKGISFEIRVMSAHRDPDTVAEYCKNARMRGLRVIIAGAGLSAALPGVAAAHTDLPVDRRPAVEPPQRDGRPRRRALDRPDAAGRAGRVRRARQRQQRRPPRRAHPGRLSRRVASERPPRPTSRARASYGELLATALQVFKAHVDVLLTLALVLVAPVTLLVDGVWGRMLADGLDAKPSPASQAVSAALSVFLVAPARHGGGRAARPGPRPRRGACDVRSALGAAARVFPRVLAAEMLYAVVVIGGLILFIVPGIWLGIRCYFAAQAAALDGLGPAPAMRQSAEVVQGAWWRTLGCLVLTGLMLGFTAEVATAIVGSTGSGALYVAMRIVAQAIAVGDHGGVRDAALLRPAGAARASGLHHARLTPWSRDRSLHARGDRRALDGRGADGGLAAGRGRRLRGDAGPDARRPRGDPRGHVHRRGRQGARGGHRPRRRRLRGRPERERRDRPGAGSTSA